MKYFLGLSSTYSAGDTLRHTFASGGEFDLAELRAFLAAHYGATYDHVAVYANGRTALNTAIKAIVKRGGKVVVTSFTCYAVVQAVKAAGCVPVFADIDKNTLHFGKEELEKALEGENNVQAIIVQNNLGIPIDIAAIEEVASAHKLAIIEDLAHCAGVKYADGREAGTVGRAVALSFGKGKSIDTVTGGAVIFTDPLDGPVKQPADPPAFKDNFRARIYPLLCAIIRGGYHICPKFGQVLTSGFVKIHAIKRSAEGKIDQKTRLTFWQSKLALRALQSMPRRGRKPIRDFYLVDDRDAVLAGLAKNGYFFQDFWYDTPVAPARYFHKADFHADSCPVASKIATQVINFPTWYEKEDLKPALKIVKSHLVSGEITDEAVTEAESLKKEDTKPIRHRRKHKLGLKFGSKDKKSDDQGKSGKSGDQDKDTSDNQGKSDSPSKTADQGEAAESESENKSGKSDDDTKTEEPNTRDNSAEPDSKKQAAGSAKKEGSHKDKKPAARPQFLNKISLKDRIPKDRSSKDDDLAALEQKSNILSALDQKSSDQKSPEQKPSVQKPLGQKPSDQEPNTATVAPDKPANATTAAASKSTPPSSAVSEPTSPSATAKKPAASVSSPAPAKQSPAPRASDRAHVITRSGSMPGMRVAPEKLSDREKLKAELEQGKKGGQSVF